MRIPLPCLALILGASLGCLPLPAAETLETIDRQATEWVRLRNEASRLESDWTTEKTLLQGSIQALETRLAGLEEAKTATLAATARERGEQGDLASRNAEAAKALADADAQLQELSAELTRLRPQLPPRLSLALELPFRSLAEKGLSPGERMHFVMTVLNRCIQFNRVITYSEEAVTLGGEKEGRLLRVLYWGVAQAYALDTGTHKAYLGRPAAGTWRWEPLPDSADQVAELLAVHNEKSDPHPIPVPALLGGNRAQAERTTP